MKRNSKDHSAFYTVNRLQGRVARFSTTKYRKFLSVDPSKSSPPNVSIYNSMHVAIRAKLRTSSEYCWNSNKIESNPCLCSASSTRLPTWHCPHLLLSAVLRPRAAALLLPGAVDRYLLRLRRSAANPPHTAAAFDWWDRLTDGQTDGPTPDRFIDPAPHTMRAVSKSESSCQIADAQPHWIFCEDSEYTNPYR